jgi:hypothetical protein
VVRNMAGPSNPHAPADRPAERGIAGQWEEKPG